MLVFPAEPAHPHLSGRFHNGHAEDLAADFLVRRFALLLRKVDERLIGHGLDEPVAQQAQRKAKRPNRLRVGNSFLNLAGGKSPVWTNRAIVH